MAIFKRYSSSSLEGGKACGWQIGVEVLDGGWLTGASQVLTDDESLKGDELGTGGDGPATDISR